MTSPQAGPGSWFPLRVVGTHTHTRIQTYKHTRTRKRANVFTALACGRYSTRAHPFPKLDHIVGSLRLEDSQMDTRMMSRQDQMHK